MLNNSSTTKYTFFSVLQNPILLFINFSILFYMDPVDILMLCVVFFSVLVFLITQNLELLRKSKISTGQYNLETARARYDQGDKKSLGAESNQMRPLLYQENTEKETENIIASSEKSEEMFDGWEGIEMTELDKIFGEAVFFVSNADKIDGDLKLQLYGLQKIALQGTCHGSRPMAFKVSARANWNAWQKLGNMSREMAMQKYVNILVKAIPEWKCKYTGAVKDASPKTNRHSPG